MCGENILTNVYSITEVFTWALVFPGFALKNASDLVYDSLDEVSSQ